MGHFLSRVFHTCPTSGRKYIHFARLKIITSEIETKAFTLPKFINTIIICQIIYWEWWTTTGHVWWFLWQWLIISANSEYFVFSIMLLQEHTGWKKCRGKDFSSIINNMMTCINSLFDLSCRDHQFRTSSPYVSFGSQIFQ